MGFANSLLPSSVTERIADRGGGRKIIIKEKKRKEKKRKEKKRKEKKKEEDGDFGVGKSFAIPHPAE